MLADVLRSTGTTVAVTVAGLCTARLADKNQKAQHDTRWALSLMGYIATTSKFELQATLSLAASIRGYKQY